MKIDLSLANEALYHGCKIQVVDGRLNLKTPAQQAKSIVKYNIIEMLRKVPANERNDATLTGPMAVWAYIVVYDAAVRVFKQIWYDNGRERICVTD